jgi:hypothetical protein
MSDLGYPVQVGSLGAVLGVGAAILTSGSDARKVSQIGGLTAAGVGLGMMLDPDGSGLETIVGLAAMLIGTSYAVFGGV